MCGLAFVWRQGGIDTSLTSAFADGLETLSHRGPDDRRQIALGNALLGHVRLSIIDLSTSHQPMTSPDGRYSVVFNGEIYNYKSLRERLIHRWEFQTQGDTEVLLAGLILEGDRFLRKLEGMWAFVMWDSQTETALLSRDRMGKKPLFYEVDRGGMSFSSELPLLSRLSKKRCEDLSGIADYFRYGFFLPGHTAYTTLKEVLPGSFMRCRAGKIIQSESYWKLERRHYSGTRKNAEDDLRSALDDSVKRRLVSDVEVGAFLSGGVDSSIVSAIAQRHMCGKLKTFTIGFESKTYDEREYARHVSGYLGTEHYEDMIGSYHYEQLDALLVNHIGQPFLDSSILPTATVSKLAATRVKVALSGDGGDELFCGYERYRSRKLVNIYTRLPRLLRKQVEKTIRLTSEPSGHHSRSLLKKAHLFLALFDRIESERPYVAPRLLGNDSYKRLFPGLDDRGYAAPPTSNSDVDEVVAMMLSDAQIYLPQDIHTKVDRASMAHSLEVRAPFMDAKVVELAFSLPLSWNTSWRINKPMLHSAFANLIPRDIWRRRKQGFAVPISEWFRGELGEQFEAQLESVKGDCDWLDFGELKGIYQQHKSGKRDAGQLLWMLYTYMIWKNGLAATTTKTNR